MTHPQSQEALEALVDSLTRAVVQRVITDISSPKAVDSLEALVDSLTRAFTRRAIGEISSSQTRDSLGALVDSLTRAFTRRAIQELSRKQARDSLEALVSGLARNFVLNATTGDAKGSIAALVDSLGGVLTKRVTIVLDSIYPPSTRQSIDSIAANLAELTNLPPSTRQSIDTIFANLAKLTSPQTLTFLQASVKELLGIAIVGLILLAIVIGYFYVRSRRNRQMFDVVSEIIDEMDDDKREEVAKRIEQKAVRTGIQPHLHKALQERRGQQAGRMEEKKGLDALHD